MYTVDQLVGKLKRYLTDYIEECKEKPIRCTMDLDSYKIITKVLPSSGAKIPLPKLREVVQLDLCYKNCPTRFFAFD